MTNKLENLNVLRSNSYETKQEYSLYARVTFVVVVVERSMYLKQKGPKITSEAMQLHHRLILRVWDQIL